MNGMKILYDKLVSKDLVAFKYFYDQNKDVIYSYVLKNVKNHDLTKDIIQDAFVRFWKKIEYLDSSKDLKSYLYSITKNLVFEEFRKK